jgi:site-specific DNA-methyltransferase (adenine-specific)
MLKIDKIYNMDCLQGLKQIDENSINAIITDPPYQIGFMGKEWDKTGISYNMDIWKECLRVLKPGGYLLSFGGTRTYHRIACAIEDAGFEIRDMIEYCYGSGFPKSLDIGKAVDKIQGNEREVIGEIRAGKNALGQNRWNNHENKTVMDLTKGTSEWEGWGTALKPAHEPICMARKPLSERNVALNVLKWGTGGLDIERSRVGVTVDTWPKTRSFQSGISSGYTEGLIKTKTQKTGNVPNGRYPANFIHDNSEEVRKCFPDSKSVQSKRGGNVNSGSERYQWSKGERESFDKESAYECGFNDSGNASRFFKSIIYTAKASKNERNKGCEKLKIKQKVFNGQSEKSSVDMKDVEKRFTTQPEKNNHPTVKPIELMEYLIKMVSKENDLILDPFLGSGTTALACKRINRRFIGIEINNDYVEIAKNRIKTIPDRLELFC